MTPRELVLVGIALLGISTVSYVLGVLTGFRGGELYQRSRGSTGEDEDSQPRPTTNRTSDRGGTVYHPSTDDDDEGAWTGPPNPGPDPSRDARRDVRQSERDAIRQSNSGFRGRDLSDREVEAWLEEFGL